MQVRVLCFDKDEEGMEVNRQYLLKSSNVIQVKIYTFVQYSFKLSIFHLIFTRCIFLNVIVFSAITAQQTWGLIEVKLVRWAG